MSDNDEQQEESRKKKKKSRGNRKLQRFRAKLKKQGLNTETITMMINTYNDRSYQPDVENIEDLINQDINVQDLVQLNQQEVQDVLEDAVTMVTKRKREIRPTGVTTSVSQISMVQPLEKRLRSTTAPFLDVVQSKDKSDRSTSAVKPNYLKTSDHIFKKMLSTALEGTEDIIRLLDTPEKLKYAREYAQLVNDFFYLRLKQDFWEDYYKILVTTRIWSMKISKQFIKENKLDQIQFVTQKNVEKYRQTTIEQLKQAGIKLNQHKQIELGQSIDLQQLSTIIPAFVRKGQHKLSVDFEYKKLLLQFDTNDYNFIQTFYNLKPSEDQIISAKMIWQATMDKQQAEQNVAILKKRLYIKRLPASYNVLDHSIDNIEKMVQNLALHQDESATILSRRQKMIGQFKYDLILLEISTNEQIARNHTNIIASEKKKIIESAGVQVPLPKSLVTLLDAISSRVFFRGSSGGYRRKAGGWNNHRSDTLKKFSHIRLSSPIIEVAPYPSLNYIEYLANGPPFIPICQSHFSNSSVDIRITKQYDTLVNCFKNSFHDNCVSASDQRANEFFASIKDLLLISHTTPLPPRLLTRAQYEQQMIKTIKRTRNKHNIIIQRSDKSKVFHLASANSYHDKSLMYMEKTQAYQEIESGINPIKDHFDRIVGLIKPLLNNKAINFNIWKQSMYPNIQTIELPHLYFIPKPHKIGTPLRPIISMIRSPAIGVSHFLDQFLRPIFNQATKKTTFINDIHFVRRLEFYCSLGLLTPTTNFITFDVTDLYTMIPRNGALVALEEFLNERTKNGRINGMTINTLMKLAETVLDTNSFVYEGKYYKQIRGGAMGSPFTMTLANIYMLKWEQSLIQHQKAHNELYGRYIDDVFMTTNLPLNQINILLDQVNNADANINITRSVGSTAEFLDVSVFNNEGQLKTTVFHKPAAAPYILPFLSDHPRHVHRNTIKGALYRAVRLCSHVKDFDQERLHIELTLLLNGYPPKFISYHFKQFFKQNNAISLMEQLDNDIYRQLHDKLIRLPTRRERKRQQQQQQMDSDPSELEQKTWNKKEVRVHFTYSSGPMSDFPQKLRQLWNKYYVYPGSLMNNVTLKIGSGTNKSLQHLLVKKKPPKSMLINIDPTNI
ncbi:unnamed protein product [Adineta steineri]|uniref:Reverse transcriptase domain-containing protein n=1 Tax=Adineta steineri TaxID=433720 RepID=A0A816CDV9_9BILA|nr:unnamed protein product [Adineta steineri]